MSDDRWPRIQLVTLEARRLNAEAKTCTDLERLRAINDELQVLYDSILEIRREQLIEQMQPEPKRPSFWKRFRRRAAAAQPAEGGETDG